MSFKIKVYADVSVAVTHETVDLSELGYSEERWNLLDKDEQREILQEYFDNLPDQPCWIVSDF